MKQINLRLPDPLHAAVVEAATQDDRSLNKEILCLVREALAARSAR